MERQDSDDTRDVSKLGMWIDTAPTTVLDMANNPSGTGNWNQPTGQAPRDEMIDPGLRGYYNDHDADDK